MSIEVSEEAVEQFTGAVVRNFDAFPSQAWVDTASAVLRSHGNQAAAQLVAGEPVEWVTAGIVHRYGKVWPQAILVVTPHRLILTASRGSLRAKHDINSLYRGPESLLGTARRLLPGSNRELWMLEIASELGPFVFALPDFNRAGELAELTASFVAGRATYDHESGQILLDGVPHSPTGGFIGGVLDPFDPTPEPVEAAASEPVEPPAYEETVTMAMPAVFADTGAATATQATPLTIPEQYSPPDLYVRPAPTNAPDPLLDPFDDILTKPEVVEAAPAPEPVAVVTEPAPSYTELPPADWYEDPIGEARLRYWDGSAWTRSVAR